MTYLDASGFDSRLGLTFCSYFLYFFETAN